MIDIYDDQALAKAAMEFAVGGRDLGFREMLQGGPSRELAERAMVSCIAMAMDGSLNGNASAVMIMATKMLHEAGSRAAMPLWERVAEDFVAGRNWPEDVMITVGRALMSHSFQWGGWGNVLSVSKGEDCKGMAREAILSSGGRHIGSTLYSTIRCGSVDHKLVGMAKERFGLRIIGASSGGLASNARTEVRAVACSTDKEEREFDSGVEEDPFGEMEEALWKPSDSGKSSGNARSADKRSTSSGS